MTALRRALLALGAASAALLAACSGEDACAGTACAACVAKPRGVWLYVSDTRLTAVPGVTAQGFTCGQDSPNATTCFARFRQDADAYDVTVSAPGYVTATVQVDETTARPPPTCCPDCSGGLALAVVLDPA